VYRGSVDSTSTLRFWKAIRCDRPVPFCAGQATNYTGARFLSDSRLQREWLKVNDISVRYFVDQDYVLLAKGICTYPVSSSTLDETVSYAGVVVYAAKKNRKNRTQVYSSEPSQISATPASIKFGEQCAQTIYALTAAIDLKDHHTYQHSQNVSLYAAQLAESIGLQVG
jgi:HD-GYP domain-containing protein (c-di-GMP phosphodiesterase class II)